MQARGETAARQGGGGRAFGFLSQHVQHSHSKELMSELRKSGEKDRT